MSAPARMPDRDDVVAVLAELGSRDAGAVGETIESLELTWLITKMEQEYQVSLDFSDDELAAMTTVSGAVAELHKALGGAGHA